MSIIGGSVFPSFSKASSLILWAKMPFLGCNYAGSTNGVLFGRLLAVRWQAEISADRRKLANMSASGLRNDATACLV